MSLHSVLAQNRDWVTLNLPQAGILGLPVATLRNGDISFQPSIVTDGDLVINTRVSADSRVDYTKKFKSFVSQIVNTSRVSIQRTQAKKLLIHSLGQRTVDNLKLGGAYVYEGLTADSVTMTLAAKRSTSLDIARAVKALATTITAPGALSVIKAVTPFVDSLKYIKGDSVYYKIVIGNPTVYFQVKVINLLANGNLCRCDWEKCCLKYLAYRPTRRSQFPGTTRLIIGKASGKDVTGTFNPDFCGPDGQSSVGFFLKVENSPKKGMTLSVWGTDGTARNSLKKFMDVPVDVDGTLRTWRLDRTYLTTFQHGATVLKSVYIEVSAKQVDATSLDVLNWKEGTNDLCNNALTCLRYPEFKAIYTQQVN